MTAKTPCEPDELRTLFLFEALTDEQLAVLCTNGQIAGLPTGPDLRRGRTGDLLLRPHRGRADDVEALRRSGHRNQPDIAARRVLRRLAGVHRRQAEELRRLGARDQAVAVLRDGRAGVRPVHEGPVPDGGPPARRHRRRHRPDPPDHRQPGEAAGAGPVVGRADPSAEQSRRGHRAGRRRAARPNRQHAAQTGDARRRHRHARDAERPGAAAGGGRRAGRQVGVATPERDRDRRPRGRRRRLAGRPRHRRRMGHRTDVRRRRHRHRLAGADFRGHRRTRRRHRWSRRSDGSTTPSKASC